MKIKSNLAIGIYKNCRLYAINGTEMVEEARDKHGLLPIACSALGRTMCASAMMGSMLKDNGKITIIINGGGQLGTIMAESRSNGDSRGYVANPHVDLNLNKTDKITVSNAVGTKGYLKVIKDLNLKEAWTGVSSLQTGEIGDDLSYYFLESEQTASVVSLGVLINPNNTVLAAGGFIIQMLPGHSEEDIQEVENVIKSFPPVSSLIKDGLSPSDILLKLFANVKILDNRFCKFKCSCSREKTLNALKLIGDKDIKEMINEGSSEVICQFCSKKRTFNKEELSKLLN